MRIPVSVSDIESKSFSKVAKTLSKRWPGDALSSMQSQNLLATFLGYRDLHDLQSNLVPPIRLNYKTCAAFRRGEVDSSIAWDISRRHAMPFGAALTLVESLPLTTLAFDNLTSERHTQALFEAERQAGRFLIMDEYHRFANGSEWFEGTPLLLEAGAPEYKFVILPGGKAIRWSNIEGRVNRLPDDLPARLRAEPKYQGLATDDRIMVSFYRDEILPNVLESAPEAILADRELAPGFELKLYSERSLVHWFDVRPKSVSASTEAIPKWHREFHDHLNQVINTRASQAESHITEAIKNGRLAGLILKQAGDTSGFEAETLRRIGQWHPSTPWQEPGYEVEHDQDSLDECQREHDEAVDHYRDLGQAIALSFPDIASLGALTLGWLDYQHKDTSYGSRDAWMVDSFNPANQSQVRAYFAFLLYRFCTTSSDSSSSEDIGMGHGKALQIMVAEVLAGSCRPDNLVREYSRLSRLIAKLRKQDSQIEEIEVWRRQIQYGHQLAGKGQYLYCSEMVPKSKPEPFLNEMFRQARSLNHMTKYFVQKSSDFKYLAGKASRAEDQIRPKLNVSDEYATIDGKSYDE